MIFIPEEFAQTHKKEFLLRPQKTYDDLIDSMPIHFFPCSKCHHHNMKKHGHYSRYLHLPGSEQKIVMRMVRLICKECGHTDTIFLYFMVPFCRFCVSDLTEFIIECTTHEISVPDRNHCIDMHDITAAKVLDRFNTTFSRILKAQGLSILTATTLEKLFTCMSKLSRQFLEVQHHADYYQCIIA